MKIFSPKIFKGLILISLLQSLIASSYKDNATDQSTSDTVGFIANGNEDLVIFRHNYKIIY